MKTEIIKKLLSTKQELDKTPSGIEFYKLSGYSKRTVSKYFGTYNNLLLEANLPVTRMTGKFITTCKNCNNQLLIPNYKLKENNFCNQTCANTYNNPNPKINRTSCCDNCLKTFTKTKDQVSNTCSQFCYMELGMKNRLMKDSVKRGGANTYDNVRQNARTYSKYFYPAKCMICNYDKHYEVCHVKDLKDFTREETLYEVNNKTNLIHLCPNCHWEFDHNQLDIKEIREAQESCSNQLS